MNTVFGAVVLLAVSASLYQTARSETGKFWHISDHHWDSYYNETADPTKVCPSSYGKPTFAAGPLGDHRCDSPWALIKSSIDAMKRLEPKPDFIIWTGDDTLHTGDQDKYLGTDKVLDIIGNITSMIEEAFPTTTIFPALGNHDFHPKSQIAPGGSPLLTNISDLWKDWLGEDAYQMFKKDGFYSKAFGSNNQHVMIVLNSNFWYDSNKQVSGTGDPANEFEWLETTLRDANDNGKKVYIIGHVPPGYFELPSNFHKRWFYPDYNKRFIDIIRQYYNPAIAGMFFGHHHTDHFKVIKDSAGKAIAALLLAPGVTPWTTTLPGVDKGANNPGIRLFEYDKDTLLLQDYNQYYLNLDDANQQSQSDTPSLWESEYSAKEIYNIPDITTSSWAKLAEDMRSKMEANSSSDVKSFKDYYIFNSVSYNFDPCNETCQMFQLCAVTEVSTDGYESCMKNWGNLGHKTVCGVVTLIISAILSIINLYIF